MKKGETILDAYILINAKPGKVWKIAEDLLKVPKIDVAHVVTGQYDIIAHVKFEDMYALKKVLSRVQNIGGITRTQTAVSMVTKSKEPV